MAFPILGIVTTVFGAIGGAIKGIFGFKKEQAKVLTTAIEVLSTTSASNAEREQAIAKIISSEANSGYWLAAVWRPIMMVTFGALIVSFWFGYMPPNLNETMSPVLAELFTIIKIGIAGYIPARTIEKIISQINLSGVLKKFIEKKLV